jgi:hypothetical protein
MAETIQSGQSDTIGLHPDDSASQMVSQWVHQQASISTDKSALLRSSVGSTEIFECLAYKESEDHEFQPMSTEESEANTYTPQTAQLTNKIRLVPDLNRRRRILHKLAYKAYKKVSPARDQKVYLTEDGIKYWEKTLAKLEKCCEFKPGYWLKLQESQDPLALMQINFQVFN